MAVIENIYREGAPAGQARKLVVMLHGLGANGQDLIGLAPFFGEAGPDIAFVSPDAPFPCDMAPVGYQWFSLQDRDMDKVLAGVQTAEPILNNFLDQMIEEYGLQPSDVVVMGFSQGSMMSLYTVLRRDQAMAGIMAYSGALVGDVGPQKDTPILLVHGQADDVVPFTAFEDAGARLKEAGLDPEGYAFPGLSHGIDDRAAMAGLQFLKQVLSTAK